MVLIQGQTGPQFLTDGAPNNIRTDRSGSIVVQDAHGSLAETAQRGNVFSARCTSITAMVIYTTAAGTGGPFIWNSSTNKVVSILKVGWTITTAATATGMIGVATGTGMTVAPTNVAITDTGNCYIGGPASSASVYNTATSTGTPRFIPLAQISTGATSTVMANTPWFDFRGALVIPPNCWVSLASSATLTTCVMSTTMLWEELPL
jgi:hypothetical protein